MYIYNGYVQDLLYEINLLTNPRRLPNHTHVLFKKDGLGLTALTKTKGYPESCPASVKRSLRPLRG